MTSEDPRALARAQADGHITWREIAQKSDPATVSEPFVALARFLRPSTTQELAWLPAASPTLKEVDFGSDTGMWCIVRPATMIDTAWDTVRTAVLANRLHLAKCSTAAGAALHGGAHVICVYCPRSSDRADVMRVREVLREMGFTEELGYTTDRATIMGVYGTPNEWLYRA
jgi:hypothetical protein